MTKRFEEFRPLSSFLVLCLAMALASSCSDKKKDEGIPQDESKTSHPSNGGDSDATFGERDDDDVELIGTVVAVQEQPGTNSPSPSGTGEFSVGPIEGASGVYGNEFEIPGAQVNCCFQRGNRPAEQFLGVVAYVDPVLTVDPYDAAHGGFVRLAIGSEIAPIHEFFLSKDPRDTLIVARAENKKRITHSTEIVNIGELVFSMKESAENDIPSPLSDRKTEELQAELAQLQQQWADEIFTIKKPMEEAIRGPEWKLSLIHI